MTTTKQDAVTKPAETVSTNPAEPAKVIANASPAPTAPATGGAIQQPIKKPLGVKEVIPFEWKLLGESCDGYFLTLFKAIEREDVEAQQERVLRDGYYTNLRILPADELVKQPKLEKERAIAAKVAKKKEEAEKKIAAQLAKKKAAEKEAEKKRKAANKAAAKAKTKPKVEASKVAKKKTKAKTKAAAKKTPTNKKVVKKKVAKKSVSKKVVKKVKAAKSTAKTATKKTGKKTAKKSVAKKKKKK